MLLFRLEEGGQTALGPALLLSVLLAGHVPGSKVAHTVLVSLERERLWYKLNMLCR